MVAYVGLPLLGLVIWDVVVVFAFKLLHWEWVGSKNVPLALYGSAIGIIVGFRNNSAYARWWEARGLWGQIVNNSRSLARQVCTVVRCPESHSSSEQSDCRDLRRQIVHLQIAYVHALRQQLRGLDVILELRSRLSRSELADGALAQLDVQKNIALTIQKIMGDLLREAYTRGWVNALEWQAMDRNLDDLADAQGGAERIKNTPMPKQYDYFPMLFVRIYCMLLPVGMVESLGWFTPLGSTLVGFMFLALDKIGKDLEDPFDNKIFDVPLKAICTTIDINLRQLLDEKELPAPEVPVKGVLW
jgi:putative membrane protein